MSYIGTVENGQIKLPPDAKLPEGASVTVTVNDATLYDGLPDWATSLVKLTKNRDWPEDYATNLDHYLYGTPKK